MNEQQEASTTSDVAGGDHRTEQVHEPSQQAVAAMIAKRLGETTTGARVQLKRIVQALGRTQARALLEETLRIEDNGGMLVPDGSRRRTPGGVFFYLASTVGQPKPGRTLMRRAASAPVDGRPQDLPQPAKVEDQPSASLLPGAPFAWEMRSADIDEIVQTATGRATSVKITLVGTMGTCVDKGACVVGVMQHSGEKLPALPKGVPAPQAIQTSYVVYIGAKQWKTVAATVSDPEDALIVEGFPQIDTKTGTIAVYVSSVTSKKLQAAKRQG
jgi:PHAX RNA-binding domain